jgi:hypothetical protein
MYKQQYGCCATQPPIKQNILRKWLYQSAIKSLFETLFKRSMNMHARKGKNEPSGALDSSQEALQLWWVPQEADGRSNQSIKLPEVAWFVA